MWLLLAQHVMLPHPNLTPSPPEPPDLTPPINPSVIYVRGRVTAQVLASTADTEPKQSNSSSEACLCCSRFSVHVSRLLRPFPFLYLLAASSFNWIKSSSTNVAYHHLNSRDLLVVPPPLRFSSLIPWHLFKLRPPSRPLRISSHPTSEHREQEVVTCNVDPKEHLFYHSQCDISPGLQNKIKSSALSGGRRSALVFVWCPVLLVLSLFLVILSW